MVKTRVIRLGGIPIGGGSPVTVQTMTKTDTRDVDATLGQIRQIATAGCDIVRIAVPDTQAADALARIVPAAGLPVVADIHFDYRLALQAVAAGVHGLRINPGNIGGEDRVREVVAAARNANVPIRIGVNAGSLERDILDNMGSTPEAMVASAARHIGMLEKLGFHAIKVSLKASDVKRTVRACRLFAEQFDYPQHIGITEAGTPGVGLVKSNIGIGALLMDGIGDTIRVSLTGDPVEEVKAGRGILQALGLLPDTPRFVSCPTCGRMEFDIQRVAPQIEAELARMGGDITVAVMGCAVNGPGEAREADVAICGGPGYAAIYRKGRLVAKVGEDHLIEQFMAVVRDVLAEGGEPD